MTGSRRLLGEPPHIAENIRSRIREELRLTASIGIAANKFLAKIASDLNKPDGQAFIGDEALESWFPALPVEKLWGVGPATAERLHALGIRTIGQLRDHDPALLSTHLGSDAAHFHALAHGRDDRPVITDHQARSIGQEQTFEEDLTHAAEIRRVLLEQAEQIGWRLRRSGLLARGVQIKIRFGDFETVTRSVTLPEATGSTADLWDQAEKLFETWRKSGFRPVRLIGMAATRLSGSGGQMSLFENLQQTRSARADLAADRIRGKFGASAIRRGGTLPDPPRHKS